VGFDPSAWSRGSYLEVAVQWLWHRQSGFCYEFGKREGAFVPFKSPEQFEPEARRFAALAAYRVNEYRMAFSELEQHQVVLGRDPALLKNNYFPHHIGVSYGLLGRPDEAHDFLSRALIADPFAEWHHRWNEHVRQLIALLPDTAAFRARVTEVVHDQRAALKLPERELELPGPQGRLSRNGRG
jgi:tetratricopeptide (TPR) repeat protein